MTIWLWMDWNDPMLQIHGYSITYRIATGKQQGRKVFTLQTIAPMAEQGFASGCNANVVGLSLRHEQLTG
jgi:hypothetical protein